MTLLDLTGEYKELLEMMQDPDVDPELIDGSLEAVVGEISVKCDSYVAVMTNLESRSDLYKAEAKRLQAAAGVIDNNISRMKERLKYALESMGKTEIAGTYNKVKIVKNGGLAPLKITGQVPDCFTKITVEADNKRIREALADGQELDFAHLEERGTHLKIN